MVSIDKFIDNSINFGVFFSTMGLLGQLRNKRETLTNCLVANGNIGLTLILIGSSAKIYKSIIE